MLCAALRGESIAWPTILGDDLQDLLIDRAEHQGVTALFNEAFSRLPGSPPALREAIRGLAIAQAFWELRRQQVVGEAITALAMRGLEPVVFKGTALAYGLYPNPVERPGADTDIIVAPATIDAASETLISLGFEKVCGLSYQDSFTKDTGDGGCHAIDFHRRINNYEMLSGLFSYDELRSAASPLPALCPGALAAGRVHALLLACLHRATHISIPIYEQGVAHYGEDRLIWLYDIHLLAEALAPPQWHEFISLATGKGLCSTCLEGLERAALCFSTRLPDQLHHDLRKTGEPATIYLRAGRTLQTWFDFTSVHGAAGRASFVRALLFPPKAYMQAMYGEPHAAWLPWLYARRAARGLVRRLGRGHRKR